MKNYNNKESQAPQLSDATGQKQGTTANPHNGHAAKTNPKHVDEKKNKSKYTPRGYQGL